MPLIVSEGGVGRGSQPLTYEMNLDKGQGGNTMTSYGPAVSYITNKQRAFLFDNTNIGIATFNANYTQIGYWHCNQITGHLYTGQDFMGLTENLSQHVGTMRPLPAWVQ